MFAPSVHTSALSSSNYTNYIIDDAVFRDSGTMSDTDIQAFLNSQGSGLAGFSAVEDCGSSGGAHYSFYASYYACGQNASAAQIIGAASRAYGINPRVILATLQKEQSLITTPNPNAGQLNCAMGYSSCSGYSGFFSQVDNATWQFKTYMELGSGNNWWGYTPASYPCNGATSLYNNALKAGRTVTFSDTNGTPYSTITLANMSTAGMYCYTPHVYNNPSGLFGNPQYGSTGLYYSGSYNFVKAFVSWWGSTYQQAFKATFAGQSGYPTIVAGNSSHAHIRYQNSGGLPWYDDVSAPPRSTYAVHLASTNPINSQSPFSAFWPTSSRPATTFAAVYEADNVTLAADQHIALPGQIVQFEFDFSIPPGTGSGLYRQYLQPILEGSTMWDMGALSWLDVTVQQPTFQAAFAGQDNTPSVLPGENSNAYIRYRNVGNQPWYDGISAPPRHTYAVNLATTNPINNSSPLSASWPSSNRAATQFAHVYEADGVTLAADQHIALPGQVIEYDFSFNTSGNTSPGFYRQYFQPILEGSNMWNMGAFSWLDLTVQQPTFQAAFAGQSAFPTIARGNSASVFLKYKNVGNKPWYDATSGPPRSTYAVHLASTNPINTTSPFSATWLSNNRPTATFAHVYEADGTTLASDQHIALPGQIIEFDFSFSVPSDSSTGLHRQYFQPILEGSSMWNMGAFSWLDVTVN
ncbi:MAG TPA: hypothetical protein VK534_00845 [Methylomirabilota bacterium]|nr:hypothetical protein [Methylomirabilota bacterium]